MIKKHLGLFFSSVPFCFWSEIKSRVQVFRPAWEMFTYVKQVTSSLGVLALKWGSISSSCLFSGASKVVAPFCIFWRCNSYTQWQCVFDNAPSMLALGKSLLGWVLQGLPLTLSPEEPSFWRKKMWVKEHPVHAHVTATAITENIAPSWGDPGPHHGLTEMIKWRRLNAKSPLLEGRDNWMDRWADGWIDEWMNGSDFRIIRELNK